MFYQLNQLNIQVLKMSKSKSKIQEAYQPLTTLGGNLIWTPLMPLVWSQLKSNFTNNKPIEFNRPTQEAKSIVATLNNSQVTDQILPADSYYMKCGFGQKTINQINKEVNKKFGKKTLELKEKLTNQDFISYVYMSKSLTFLNKFERRKDTSFRFNNRPVESFYAKHFEQKQQIKCYFYEGPHSFIISIRLKQRQSQFFMIKNKKIKTTKVAINTILSSIKNTKSFTLSKKDKFEMPLINTNSLREYKQIQGLQFKNQEIKNYLVKKMYEQIKFQIDECGAIMEGHGVLIGFKCPSLGGKQPKEFMLDESFWVVLKQENLDPYFCAKIENVNDRTS